MYFKMVFWKSRCIQHFVTQYETCRISLEKFMFSFWRWQCKKKSKIIGTKQQGGTRLGLTTLSASSTSPIVWQFHGQILGNKKCSTLPAKKDISAGNSSSQVRCPYCLRTVNVSQFPILITLARMFVSV